MTTPAVTAAFPHRATVTQPPTAGNTGHHQIATDHACTNPWPTTGRDFGLGDEFLGYRMLLMPLPELDEGQLIAVNGRSYRVRRVKSWPTLSEVLLERRRD